MQDRSQLLRALFITRWVRAGLIGSVAGFSLMCASQPPPAPTAIPPAAQGSTTAPSPGASATAAKTPGKVVCGATQCDLETEICCFNDDDQTGRCISKSDGAALAACAGGTLRGCDESADCAAGSACCQDSQADDECNITGRWSCSVGACGSFGVLSEEVCVAGGACKSGACAQPEGVAQPAGGAAHGYCPATKTGIPCGDKDCALGEGCCWDPTKKVGSCVKDSGDCQQGAGYSADAAHSLYWCLSGADCGGGFECFSTTGSAFYQEYYCGHSRCHPLTAVLGPRLCKTQAECPEEVYAVDGGESYKLIGCETLEGQLPGVKSCSYK